MKQRKKEIVCDEQMDLSLSVNHISKGGDAAVTPLAYFPPFILLGTLEVQYIEGV